ncbi:methyltransferase type 12 [Ilyonectria robusta]
MVEHDAEPIEDRAKPPPTPTNTRSTSTSLMLKFVKTYRALVSLEAFLSPDCDVTFHSTQVPIVSWAKDAGLKHIGLFVLAAWEKDLEGVLNCPATESGWDRDGITVFAAKVRKALRSKKLHRVGGTVIIVGQKLG